MKILQCLLLQTKSGSLGNTEHLFNSVFSASSTFCFRRHFVYVHISLLLFSCHQKTQELYCDYHFQQKLSYRKLGCKKEKVYVFLKEVHVES